MKPDNQPTLKQQDFSGLPGVPNIIIRTLKSERLRLLQEVRERTCPPVDPHSGLRQLEATHPQLCAWNVSSACLPHIKAAPGTPP